MPWAAGNNSHTLSRGNLDSIIEYLIKQDNERALGNLIASLNNSLLNNGTIKHTVYDRSSSCHSLASKAGSAGFCDEENEIKVPLLDLKEMEERHLVRDIQRRELAFFESCEHDDEESGEHDGEESGEHDGEEVVVQGSKISLPNGLRLTYGQIIAFAGDFYGIPRQPICEETNGTSYQSRFMDAFNTLGRGDIASIQQEVLQIQRILDI